MESSVTGAALEIAPKLVDQEYRVVQEPAATLLLEMVGGTVLETQFNRETATRDNVQLV